MLAEDLQLTVRDVSRRAIAPMVGWIPDVNAIPTRRLLAIGAIGSVIFPPHRSHRLGAALDEVRLLPGSYDSSGRRGSRGAEAAGSATGANARKGDCAAASEAK